MTVFWLDDLKQGLRRLWRSPASSAVVVLTLVVGIGANTAIFSVVNAVLLRPLPFREPERLVRLWQAELPARDATVPVAPANFFDWRAQSRSYEALAAYLNWPLSLTGIEVPERVEGTYVTPDLFSLLGAKAQIGRTFGAAEARPDHDHVAILSDAFWRRAFAADPAAVGRSIRLDGEPFTIVGVMPASFGFPRPNIQVWLPLAYEPNDVSRGAQYLAVIGRLRPGVSLTQAQGEIDRLSASLSALYPNTNAGWGARVRSLQEFLVGNVRTTLLLLLAVVGFFLLIGCVNVANLLLSQAVSRRQEMVVRTALGAGRSRLVRQLLGESLILSLLGGAGGVLVASWGTRLLLGLSSGTLPRAQEVDLDWRVLLFALLLSIVTGLIFGLLPAAESYRLQLADSLREGTKGSENRGRRRVRAALVVVQVALASILLVGGGLMMRSFVHLNSVAPGFAPGNVLSFRLALPEAKYDEPAKVDAFYRQVLERVASLPGVTDAAAVSFLPLSGMASSRRFVIEGSLPEPGAEPIAGSTVVTPSYWKTMRIPLVRGRAPESREGSAGEVVVSAAAASKFFSNGDPLGRRIKLGEVQEEGSWLTIVGVSGDVKHEGLADEVRPELYLPFSADPPNEMSIVVRSERSNSADLAPEVRRQVAGLDRDLPVAELMPLSEVVRSSINRPRFLTSLMSVFALVALALTVFGIAGVVSYGVAQRRREFGVRIALGAESGKLLRLVLGHALRLTAIGLGFGLIGALALTRLLSSLLFETRAIDLPTFAGAALLLLAVVAIAAYLPARRVMKIDPATALHTD